VNQSLVDRSLACRKAKDLRLSAELWNDFGFSPAMRASTPVEGHACLANLSQGTVCKIFMRKK